MSSCRERLTRRPALRRAAEAVAVGLLVAGLLAVGSASAQGTAGFPGIGRAATPKEVKAWDIDVRPDFKGLPKGAGSVARGQEVWEARCASCHGVFGESNEVFSPLVGGTTADDVKAGRVARLNDSAFPGRTTLMKVSTVSTLWDYINRAMPWTAPKSLTTDEVYAVTAYLLNLGGILPDDFVLSDTTIAQAQARLPNRNGVTTDHALWPGKGSGRSKPDVLASACMSNCAAEPKVASFLPDFARNNNGNLAQQQRLVGPQRGADTSRPPAAGPLAAAAAAATTAAAPRAAASPSAAALALAQKNNCTACHGVENKIVGPAFREIAAKHGSRGDALAYLAGKIRAGSQGVWGSIPMPAQALSDEDTGVLAQWLASGAGK